MMAAQRPGDGENTERMTAIFRERAARLARPAVQAHWDGRRRTVLMVRTGAETYGIEIRHLAEVVAAAAPARVPGAAPEVAGVMAFRGRIAPVFDFARLLRIKSGAEGPRPVLMFRRPGRSAGLLVDAVEGMREIDAGEPLAGRPEASRPRSAANNGPAGHPGSGGAALCDEPAARSHRASVEPAAAFEAGRYTRLAGTSGLWLVDIEALLAHPVVKSILGGEE